MMFLQLNPPIPCDTPKGPAFCIAMIDYSQEHDTLWKCIITATGEVWDVPQPEVRGVKNVSMGRLGDAPNDGVHNTTYVAFDLGSNRGGIWAPYYTWVDFQGTVYAAMVEADRMNDAAGYPLQHQETIASYSGIK